MFLLDKNIFSSYSDFFQGTKSYYAIEEILANLPQQILPNRD